MKWLKTFFILTLSAYKAFGGNLTLPDAKRVTIKVEGNKIFTKECKAPSNCFDFPKELKFYSYQSPLFSLCYQSGGTPKFVKIDGKKHKIEFCFKNNKGVDLETLMKAYKAYK
tara:strand:+ start:86880 stop:87218 length:339 start_codon:yes stop_codon:yes gene_type:complete